MTDLALKCTDWERRRAVPLRPAQYQPTCIASSIYMCLYMSILYLYLYLYLYTRLARIPLHLHQQQGGQ